MTVAVERYISIVCPLRHHTLLSKRNAFIIIVLCWIYGIIVGSLPLLGWNSIENSGRNDSFFKADCFVELNCTHGNVTLTYMDNNTAVEYSTFQCLYQNVISGSYAGFMYPGHFVVMWIIMSILYGRIYIITRNKTCGNSANGVRRLSESLLHKSNSAKSKVSKRVKENWKAMKILAVIVGYFIFSWMGMVVWYAFLFKGFTLDHVPNEKPVLPYWFYNVAIILAFGNSVLNPFIYGLGHRGVRKAFVSTLSFSRFKSFTKTSSPRSLNEQKAHVINGSREIALMYLEKQERKRLDS